MKQKSSMNNFRSFKEKLSSSTTSQGNRRSSQSSLMSVWFRLNSSVTSYKMIGLSRSMVMLRSKIWLMCTKRIRRELLFREIMTMLARPKSSKTWTQPQRTQTTIFYSWFKLLMEVLSIYLLISITRTFNHPNKNQIAKPQMNKALHRKTKIAKYTSYSSMLLSLTTRSSEISCHLAISKYMCSK